HSRGYWSLPRQESGRSPERPRWYTDPPTPRPRRWDTSGPREPPLGGESSDFARALLWFLVSGERKISTWSKSPSLDAFHRRTLRWSLVLQRCSTTALSQLKVRVGWHALSLRRACSLRRSPRPSRAAQGVPPDTETVTKSYFEAHRF